MVNLNIYENLLSKWKIINNNVISIARVINNILNPDYEEQITWTLTDDENNQFTTTIDGLRTIRDDMWDKIRNGVDRTIITHDSSEYESIRIGRAKSLKVSGVLSGYMTPDPNSEHVSELNGVYLSTRKDTLMNKYVKNKFGINVGKPGTRSESVFHVDGHLVYYNNNNNQYDIELPDAELPILVTSATNTNVDIKAGQMCVIDDPNELLSNGTFDTGIDGWKCVTNRGNIEWDDTNKRLKLTNTSSSYNMAAAVEFTNLIPGVKYKLRMDLDFDSSIKVSFTMYGLVYRYLTPGTNEIEFVYDRKIKNNYIGIAINTPGTTDNPTTLYIDNVSLTHVEPFYYTSYYDIASGSNLYMDNYRGEAYHYGSRQDFIGLEVWIENISDKDFVYPYGDTQNQLSVYKANLPITQVQSFRDADTYSKYGVWQEDEAIKGRGYQWSTLTDEQKNILLSDKRNNIFIGKDEELYQVRYRRRTIKGYGNLWEQLDVDERSASAYSGTAGYIYLYGLISKFTTTQFDRDIKSWSGIYNHYFTATSRYSPNNKPHTVGMFYGLDLKSYMSPIALVQRRNKGIYHPQYNPYGSGKIYYDTNNKSLTWDEVQKLDPNYIKSPVDCIDPNKISVTDGNGNFDNLTNQPTWYITGTVESGVSGRPDGLYCDTVYERDVEDKRIGVLTKSYKEILDSYKGRLRSGNFRASNVTPILRRYKRDLTRTAMGNIYFDNSEVRVYEGDTSIGRTRLVSAQPNTFVYIEDDKSNGYGIFNLLGVRNFYSISQKYHGIISNLTYYVNFFNNTINGYTTLSSYKTGYKYNSKGLLTELYGDPRDLSRRVSHTVESTSTNIDINTDMYILCNDGTNNNGTVGHVYRYLGGNITNVEDNGTSGTANASNGHIDFSDTNIWLDLGDVNSIAGISELVKYGSGFSMLNMRNPDLTYNDSVRYPIHNINGNYIKILLNRPIDKVLEVFIRDINGVYIKITTDTTQGIYYTADIANNIVTVYLNDITNTGFSNINELLDKSMIMINYEAKTVIDQIPEIIYTSLYEFYGDKNVELTNDITRTRYAWNTLFKPFTRTRFIDNVSNTKLIKKPPVVTDKRNFGQYKGFPLIFNNEDLKLYNITSNGTGILEYSSLIYYKYKDYMYLNTSVKEIPISASTVFTPTDNELKPYYGMNYYADRDHYYILHYSGIIFKLPYLFLDREFKY